jgi:hypothetical protein
VGVEVSIKSKERTQGGLAGVHGLKVNVAGSGALQPYLSSKMPSVGQREES